MAQRSGWWRGMFVVAALFNFGIGIPIAVAPEWSMRMAYVPTAAGHDELALALWRDFGVFVILIGLGYWMVSRDLDENRGIVWLGILAKGVDVTVLFTRYFEGKANFFATIPATGDAAFIVLFVLFLLRWPAKTSP